MECKFCGREMVDDAVYCFYCGKRLDGKKPCPSCKALVPDDAVFCGRCGTRIEPEVLKDEPLAQEAAGETPPDDAAEQTGQSAPPEEETESGEQSGQSEDGSAQEDAQDGDLNEENESPTEEKTVCTPKWKKAVEITQLSLAGFAALVGFVFTFCIGLTVSAGVKGDLFIYDYFGKVYENLDRIIVINNIGDTQSFALYMPFVFGTLVAIAALICNFVFTIMTVVALVRQYAYKREGVCFVKPALRTFISYSVFATVFYALNAEKVHSVGGIDSSIYFNGATLAALILGGVAFGGYFVCRAVLRLNDFTDKKEIISSSVALGTGAVGVVTAILLSMAVCRFSTAEESYSLGFMPMIYNAGFNLSDSTNCGGVMCFGIPSFAVQIALLVLTVCVIAEVAVRVGTGSGFGKKPLGMAIAAAVLTVLYFLGAFAAANMLNAEVSADSVSRSYGVPITVIVLGFIMLGGVIATIVLDKKFRRAA